MSAYLVVDIEVYDRERYETYKRMAPPSIALYGGRYLTRGGETGVLEGDWTPKRFVILEFPTMEQARVVELTRIRGSKSPSSGQRDDAHGADRRASRRRASACLSR